MTDFRLRYQASVLGYLWTLLRPLALFTILYIVFVQLLRIGASIPYSAMYLLLGIVIWGYFAETTTQGLSALVGRADLLRKISFPRYVIVVAVAVSALISFGLSMLVVGVFMIVVKVPLRADALWLPLLFVELVGFSLALALILSALYVRYRDMSYVWELVAQAAFYATPILYPPTLVTPERVAKLLMLNPMAQIIQDARYCLITEQTVTMTQLFGTPWARVIPVGIIVVTLVIAVVFFRRAAPSFAEEV